MWGYVVGLMPVLVALVPRSAQLFLHDSSNVSTSDSATLFNQEVVSKV